MRLAPFLLTSLLPACGPTPESAPSPGEPIPAEPGSVGPRPAGPRPAGPRPAGAERPGHPRPEPIGRATAAARPRAVEASVGAADAQPERRRTRSAPPDDGVRPPSRPAAGTRDRLPPRGVLLDQDRVDPFTDREPLGPPGLVMLVVLDTVRADHTSLCGYARPTTPYLQKLVRRDDAAFTCHAYSPGDWTLPSHASFFTGLEVFEHHYDSPVVPPDPDEPNLAETFAARGYQTAVVSANPVLGRPPGLLRGFEHTAVAPTLTAWRGPTMARKVDEVVQGLDDDQPLFLVVNLIDAHDPWGPIPDHVDWVPSRGGRSLDVNDPDQNAPYHRYVDGGMAPDAEETFLRVLNDVYDYGVRRADRTLEAIVESLRRRGWAEDGLRMVVTSDHGELLGEHHRLRHGGWLFEPAIRVPFVFLDTRRPEPDPWLPSPAFNTLHLWELLLEGRLPRPLRRAVSTSSRFPKRYDPGQDMVATWTWSGDKLLWWRGQTVRFDLGKDPFERTYRGAKSHPNHALIERLGRRWQTHLSWRSRRQTDRALSAALEALGYTDAEQATPADTDTP